MWCARKIRQKKKLSILFESQGFYIKRRQDAASTSRRQGRVEVASCSRPSAHGCTPTTSLLPLTRPQTLAPRPLLKRASTTRAPRLQARPSLLPRSRPPDGFRRQLDVPRLQPMCPSRSRMHRERTSCQKSCGRKRSFWPPRPPTERPSSASIGGGGAAEVEAEAEAEVALAGEAVAAAALSSWTRGSGEAAVPGPAASSVAAGSSSACSHELRDASMPGFTRRVGVVVWIVCCRGDPSNHAQRFSQLWVP